MRLTFLLLCAGFLAGNTLASENLLILNEEPANADETIVGEDAGQSSSTATTEVKGTTGTTGGSTVSATVGTSGTAGTVTTGSTVSQTAGTGTTGTGTYSTGASDQTATSGCPGTTAEPTTTTPPQVNLSHVEFTFSCFQGQCTYNYRAPVNSNSFLSTEQSLIDQDNTQIEGIKTNINTYKTNTNAAFSDAEAKMKDLRDRMEKAQARINQIQQLVQQIGNQNTNATTNLVVAQMYVDNLKLNDRDSCYYKNCLRATTPPPPTLPPTTPPTTTPSPCVGFACDNNAFNDTCLTDRTNQPYCTACIGNLDGYQHCDTSACDPNGIYVGTGPMWSPGYTGDSATATFPANSNCVWIINVDSAGGVDPDFKIVLDSDTVVEVISSDSSPFRLSNSTRLNQLNYVFKNYAGPFQLSLRTNSTQPGTFFKFTVLPKST